MDRTIIVSNTQGFGAIIFRDGIMGLVVFKRVENLR